VYIRVQHIGINEPEVSLFYQMLHWSLKQNFIIETLSIFTSKWLSRRQMEESPPKRTLNVLTINYLETCPVAPLADSRDRRSRRQKRDRLDFLRREACARVATKNQPRFVRRQMRPPSNRRRPVWSISLGGVSTPDGRLTPSYSCCWTANIFTHVRRHFIVDPRQCPHRPHLQDNGTRPNYCRSLY